ncbi:MAG: hypothetical protein IH861_09865 [Chloroflexi bacterium]|nr:hypothetical protein [Chloroflexota bacterium]
MRTPNQFSRVFDSKIMEVAVDALYTLAKKYQLSTKSANGLRNAARKIIEQRQLGPVEAFRFGNRVSDALLRTKPAVDDPELWEEFLKDILFEDTVRQMPLPLQRDDPGNGQSKVNCIRCKSEVGELRECDEEVCPVRELSFGDRGVSAVSRPEIINYIVAACPRCGAMIRESDGSFCPDCGIVWESASM